MARKTPTVRNGTLVVEQPIGQDITEHAKLAKIAVGSHAWFAWLTHGQTFAYEDARGRFTARSKRRGTRLFWYALRRRQRVLHELYLGRCADLTLDQLRSISQELAALGAQVSVPTHTPTATPAPKQPSVIGPPSRPGVRAVAAIAARTDAPVAPPVSARARAWHDANSGHPRNIVVPPEMSTGAGQDNPLTDRELDVMRYVAKGATNRAIAKELVIALSTVKHHVHSILAKLEVANRTQAAMRAQNLRLLDSAGGPSPAS